MIKISFNNHYGFLEVDSNAVIFYDLCFENITEALAILKHIVPDKYSPMYIRGHKGLVKSDGSIFILGNWWESVATVLKALF